MCVVCENAWQVVFSKAKNSPNSALFLTIFRLDMLLTLYHRGQIEELSFNIDWYFILLAALTCKYLLLIDPWLIFHILILDKSWSLHWLIDYPSPRLSTSQFSHALQPFLGKTRSRDDIQNSNENNNLCTCGYYVFYGTGVLRDEWRHRRRGPG